MANREMSEEEVRSRVRALLEKAHPDRVDRFLPGADHGDAAHAGP